MQIMRAAFSGFPRVFLAITMLRLCFTSFAFSLPFMALEAGYLSLGLV
jgi:hypothetical protein